MSSVERRAKRLKALNKLNNQLSVLSHTVRKGDEKLVKQLQELAQQIVA